MNLRNTRNAFTADMKIAEVIDANYHLTGILPRFGLGMGFGDETVAESCARIHFNVGTFLLVCNVYTIDSYRPTSEFLEKVDLGDLLLYLRRSHEYYIHDVLPKLEKSMSDLLAPCTERRREAIWKFFEEYRNELDRHFDYEEHLAFPYIDTVLGGKPGNGYNILQYEANHTDIEEKLDDLKNIIMKYLPRECDGGLASDVISSLYHLEDDLRRHTIIEDDILVPLVAGLEDKSVELKPETAQVEQDGLSAREVEILACVAKGMLNKEIADQFCISIHTVITHRKNITRKTGIKTVAGLTVYALLNNIIDIDSIE